MSGISFIEVSFPVPVEIEDTELQELDAILGRICERYEATHPDRVMWPAGHGAKMTVDPLKLSDDEPIPFDTSVYHVAVAERENYDWPCKKCGISQGDHGHCIIDPPAGACEYEPKPSP